MESVFERIDRQTQTIGGFTPFAVIWNVRGWRRYFTFCVLSSLAAWIVLGFDSTWSMTLPFIENWYQLITGQVGFWALWAESQKYYGVGNHWSAPVIYGSLWVLTSKYYERQGVVKSMNFCVTTALSLASIGTFELIWNSFYAFYQNQPWTITYMPKQEANLSSFISFVLVGILVCIYLYMDGYKPRIDRRLTVLLLVTVSIWALWINYPLPVGDLEVQLDDGSTWTNSPRFPQTFYAIDMYPGDGVAVGEPYHVNDDMVHLVNTFTKIISTATLGYFLAFKRK